MPIFSKLFDPLQPGQISVFEKRTGMMLPNDYKEFLASQNGGQPAPNELLIPKINEAVLLDLLYGIASTRQPADLETEYEEIQGELNGNFVPIGHDPGGNNFLLAVKGSNAGKIYYWDASRAFDISSETQNTYMLAGGINELLSILK